MVELMAPSEHPMALRIFGQLYPKHLMIAAIFDGFLPGELLVDDPGDPQAACLLIRRPSRAYVAGKLASAGFHEALASCLNKALNRKPFRLYYASSAWEAAAQRLIAHPLERVMRQYYERPAAPASEPNSLPAGFEIRPVDAALLERSDLRHHDALIAEIQITNPSISLDAYIARGFGVCALAGDTLAGWCLSENNTRQRCEVGIETVGEFQRQGIAAGMARAFAHLAYERGVRQIGWHCWADNTASGRTALRAGFRKIEDYPVLVASGQPG